VLAAGCISSCHAHPCHAADQSAPAALARLASPHAERGERTPPCQIELGAFQHLLVVFGGPNGLEYALQHDDLASEHSCPSELFDRQAHCWR
jgi:hypothetical protein